MSLVKAPLMLLSLRYLKNNKKKINIIINILFIGFFLFLNVYRKLE